MTSAGWFHHLVLLPAYIAVIAIIVGTVVYWTTEFLSWRRCEWQWHKANMKRWLTSAKKRRYYR